MIYDLSTCMFIVYSYSGCVHAVSLLLLCVFNIRQCLWPLYEHVLLVCVQIWPVSPCVLR